MLAARGIPFVFVTGYGAESIDKRFADVPVLQKPIEPQMLQGAFALKGNGNGAARAAATPEVSFVPPHGAHGTPSVQDAPSVRSVS